MRFLDTQVDKLAGGLCMESDNDSCDLMFLPSIGKLARSTLPGLVYITIIFGVESVGGHVSKATCVHPVHLKYDCTKYNLEFEDLSLLVVHTATVIWRLAAVLRECVVAAAPVFLLGLIQTCDQGF
jgi:hypothetical protein